jgi:heat shock protein HslJ
MLMRIGILRLLALGLALQGCSTNGTVEQRELIVGPAPVACDGDPPATCLSVSEPSGDHWLMRFDEIAGFAYQPGFTYQLMVKEPPVSDELSVMPRLALVREVSREPAAGGVAAGPLGRGEWRLQSISSHPDQAWPSSGITASFHGAGGWADGFAGCDRYLAALTVDDQKITISAPEATSEVCANDAQVRERDFLAALAKAQSFTLRGDSLELTLSDGGTMRFRASGG